MLLIVGTNRDSGKTSLAVELIRSLSYDHPVTAIKVSPHFHQTEDWENVIKKCDGFQIIKESRSNTGKDSSRMLQAGASKVYFIEAWDRNLKRAFHDLVPLLDPCSPIICESGWLRKLVKPGLFIILNRKGNRELKPTIEKYLRLDHLWIEFDGQGFKRDITGIKFEDKAWRYDK